MGGRSISTESPLTERKKKTLNTQKCIHKVFLCCLPVKHNIQYYVRNDAKITTTTTTLQENGGSSAQYAMAP
jgi:hypothetical protein